MRLTRKCLADAVSGFKARETINVQSKVPNWFPGHMAKGMKRMQMMARATDCVIEMHDARIPFTGRNHLANKAYEGRPKVLLLNKADLVNPVQLKAICKQISVQESMPVIPTWITCDQLSKFRSIIRTCHTMANADQLTIRKDKYTFFVSGIPNCGKSTFINVFKKQQDTDKNKLKVAPYPGVTKNISNRLKIVQSPPTYIYDTPGVNQPRVSNTEDLFKLAMCGAIPLKVTGALSTVDYSLFWLNRKGLYRYAPLCGLAKPSNNVVEVVAHLARARDLMTNGKPDMNSASNTFMQMFNKGQFGKIILEDL